MQQPGSLEFLQKVYENDSVIQEILQDAGIRCPKFKEDIEAFVMDFADIEDEKQGEFATRLVEKYGK